MLLKVFVSTSTSLNLIMTLKTAQAVMELASIDEQYNRYGAQTILPWGYLDESNVVLAYWNASTDVVTIGSYNRNTDGIVSFSDGLEIDGALSKHQLLGTQTG